MDLGLGEMDVGAYVCWIASTCLLEWSRSAGERRGPGSSEQEGTPHAGR